MPWGRSSWAILCPCLRVVGWWLKRSLWWCGGCALSKWVGLYPACLPCPWVLLDRATVSPDHSCLSLQYLCCNSLCVGGLGSVCYIWSLYPALSGVNLSMLSLSFLDLGPCLRNTWPNDSLLSTWSCCCSIFNCSGVLPCSPYVVPCPRPAVFNSLETAGVVEIL